MLDNLSDNMDMQKELEKSLIYMYNFETKLQLPHFTDYKRKVTGAIKCQGLNSNIFENDSEGLFIISTFWNVNL